MISKLCFSQRIVLAFVLMTIVVSGAFSMSIVAVVHFVEDQLVTKDLNSRLVSVLHEDLKAGRAPQLDSRTSFFTSNDTDRLIPARFEGLPEGMTEVEDENEAAYVYLQEINGVRYMLVQDQSEFENREDVLFSVVQAGFVLCIVGAWGLGVIMARHVMAPVSRLARQVRHCDQLDVRTPPLAPDYPKDEIGHLAAAFDSTLGQLRRSIERERLFTSDVSHELRTPLMIIATSCELLAEAPLHASQRDQVGRIERAAREMSDLVRTFLLLARSNAMNVAGENTLTLAEVASEQAERWGSEIRSKGLDFELVEEGASPSRHDATLLRTVMANLLRNALHYTAQGQVRLVLEKEGFRVEDTGLGVPVQEQSRIFEPFVRGSQARGEGLGLGLSLVKRICEHQGWSISVNNIQHGGSCFQVSFHCSS